MIRTVRSRARTWLAVAAVAFALRAGLAGAAPDLDAPLPLDPNVKVFTLPNGLECWLRSHKTPPDRVGFWMHVGSGSVNEAEDQRGLAHFLEHLAFDGSKNFPPGELIKYFESIGMTFGSHQNAFTGFDQTTYVLTLPNTEDETVRKGLLCMADYAFRLSLLPEQIDRERGVVMEEMLSRKGPGQRMFEKMLPIILPGSRVAERIPIGKEEVIRSAGREQFERYYRAWYRPDNTVLMIVGDVDPARMEQMVREAFAEWKAVPDPPADASPGVVPYSKTRAVALSDPEVTRADVSLIAVRPLETMKSVGDFRRSLVDGIGTWIMNRRLGELIRKGEAPFQSASLHKSTLWNVCTYIEAQAAGPPQKWDEMLRVLAAELKRGREYGFLTQEIEDARKAMLASAKEAARAEGTRDARALLNEMNALVSEHRMPMSKAQRLKLIEALVGTVTPEEVGEALRRNFGAEARLVLVTMPGEDGVRTPAADELLAAARRGESEALTAPAARERPGSLLAEDPRAGALAEKELDADLQVLSVTLANGVRAHLRTMDFRKNQVLVRIVLAGGVIWETPGSRGLTDVAALAFQQPATSRLTSTDVRDLLTGKNVRLTGRANRDSVVIDISGTPADVEDGFRLAHALLSDPVIEPSALKVWKEKMLQSIERRETDVRARLGEETDALLTRGDVRFRPLRRHEVDGLGVAAGRRWLTRLIRKAPMEVTVVGDIDRERALELVLKYLGSLPARERIGPLWPDLRRIVQRPGPLEATVQVDTITPTAATLVGWRGADWSDVKDRRCLQIAAQIITTRLREEVREKRGMAYSPYCSARPSKGYPGTGLLASYLTGDPDNAAEVAGLMREVMEGFAKDGPTDAEMLTVHKQFANRIETSQKEPAYWLSVMSDMDYHGTRLSDVKQALEKYTSYTREDLLSAVRKYMTQERRIQVRAWPAANAVETVSSE